MTTFNLYYSPESDNTLRVGEKFKPSGRVMFDVYSGYKTIHSDISRDQAVALRDHLNDLLGDEPEPVVVDVEVRVNGKRV